MDFVSLNSSALCIYHKVSYLEIIIRRLGEENLEMKLGDEMIRRLGDENSKN